MKHKRRNCFSFLIIFFVIFLGIIFYVNLKSNNTKSPSIIPSASSTSNEPTTSNSPQITAASTAAESEKLTEYKVPILMYHYIRDYNDPNDKTGTNLSVSLTKFEEQMKWLKDNNYKTVGFDYLLTPINLSPSKPIILTFDDGYRDAYTNALPILKKYEFNATFYIIANHSNSNNDRYMNWDQIKELKKSGMNIGSHTLSHPGLDKINNDRITNEIADSKKIIEEKIGVPISDFCYPAGKYDERAINKLKEVGYKTAVTTHNGISDQNSKIFELPRIRIQNNTNIVSILK